MADITLIAAFIAGILSFLSPCVLPLIPGYLAYLSGISLTESKLSHLTKNARLRIFLNAVLFVLGFTIVFSVLGVLLNTVLSDVITPVRIWLGRIGGTIIILFGLYLVNLIRIPWLEREHTLKAKKFKSSYITSFVFGTTFAVGWTPCIGPLLAGILTLAVVTPVNAFTLLLSYSIGLSVPFLIVGAFTSQSNKFIAKHAGAFKYVNIIGGILLIILGILVFTNNLIYFAQIPFLSNLFR